MSSFLAIMEPNAWAAIAVAVMALPQHGKMEVPRSSAPHPKDAGLYRSVGLAFRCRHYRKVLPGGRGLHVHEFPTHYRVHWDAVDPSVSLIQHFIHDVLHAMTRPLRNRRLSRSM